MRDSTPAWRWRPLPGTGPRSDQEAHKQQRNEQQRDDRKIDPSVQGPAEQGDRQQEQISGYPGAARPFPQRLDHALPPARSITALDLSPQRSPRPDAVHTAGLPQRCSVVGILRRRTPQPQAEHHRRQQQADQHNGQGIGRMRWQQFQRAGHLQQPLLW